MTLVVKNVPRTYVECPLYHVYDGCERFYVAKLMCAKASYIYAHNNSRIEFGGIRTNSNEINK